MNLLHTHPNHFHFTVQNSQVVVDEFSQYESRGNAMLEMIAALVVNYACMEGLQGSVFYGDHPPKSEIVQAARASGRLVFSSIKKIGEISDLIPLPAFDFLHWKEIGIDDGENLYDELIAHNRPWVDSRIFWIGTDQHVTRRRLLDMSRKFPEHFDVCMMGWQKDESPQLKSTTRYVSLQEHANYKYLVDCPGRGYSARLKWLICSGRPVFIVEREIVEHWHEDLIPWRHFIPVKEDLSDLMNHLRIVENDEALYRHIATNARNYARDALYYEAQLMRTVTSMTSLNYHMNRS